MFSWLWCNREGDTVINGVQEAGLRLMIWSLQEKETWEYTPLQPNYRRWLTEPPGPGECGWRLYSCSPKPFVPSFCRFCWKVTRKLKKKFNSNWGKHADSLIIPLGRCTNNLKDLFTLGSYVVINSQHILKASVFSSTWVYWMLL